MCRVHAAYQNNHTTSSSTTPNHRPLPLSSTPSPPSTTASSVSSKLPKLTPSIWRQGFGFRNLSVGEDLPSSRSSLGSLTSSSPSCLVFDTILSSSEDRMSLSVEAVEGFGFSPKTECHRQLKLLRFEGLGFVASHFGLRPALTLAKSGTDIHPSMEVSCLPDIPPPPPTMSAFALAYRLSGNWYSPSSSTQPIWSLLRMYSSGFMV